MKAFLLAWWTACLFGLVVAGGPLLGGLLGEEASGSQKPAASATPLSLAASSTGSPPLAGSILSPMPISTSVVSPHPSNRPLKPGDDSPSRPPDVIVTRYGDYGGIECDSNED